MKDVHAWAVEAEMGDRIVYYREWVGDWGCPEACAARDSALQAHEAGLVFLAQRRVRQGRYAGQLQYEATRISGPTLALLESLQSNACPDIDYRRVNLKSRGFLEKSR